jgi:sec-independent protein translocase protein TatA
MPIGIGPMEIIVVLVIALVILGPKRLPAAGRSVGRGMREFRSAVTGNRNDADDHVSALVPASEASVPEPARRAV